RCVGHRSSVEDAACAEMNARGRMTAADLPPVRRRAALDAELRTIRAADSKVGQQRKPYPQRRGQRNDARMHEVRHREAARDREVNEIALEPGGVSERIRVPVDELELRVARGSLLQDAVELRVGRSRRGECQPEDVL